MSADYVPNASRKNLYLSRPISGLTNQQVFYAYDYLIMHLRPYYKLLSPMVAKDALRPHQAGEIVFATHDTKGTNVASDHSIVKRDYWMVSQASVGLFDFTDGHSRVSIGCVSELAWSHQLRNHNVVVLQPGNAHYHAFVLEMADVIFLTLDDAIAYLVEIAESAR